MIPRGSLDSLTAEDLRLLLNGMGDISTQALIGYTSFNDESSMHSSFLDHFSLSVADIPSRTRFSQYSLGTVYHSTTSFAASLRLLGRLQVDLIKPV